MFVRVCVCVRGMCGCTFDVPGGGTRTLQREAAAIATLSARASIGGRSPCNAAPVRRGMPGLLDGLENHVPDLELHCIEDATHWIVHEQPALVARLMGGFLARPGSKLSTQAAGQAGGS